MTTTQKLSGSEKAALVILFLEEDLAAEVLSNLDEDELRRLAGVVDSMDPVPQDALATTLEDFEKRLQAPAVPGNGTAYMRRIATAALGQEQAERLFLPASRSVSSPLEAIRQARSETLAELLEEEHPQVAAVVLTQLPQTRASRVLQHMPDEVRSDLVGRVARLEEIPERVLQAASESLMSALAEAGGLTSQEQRAEFDGVDFVASVLNEMGTDDSDQVLETLEEEEFDTAKKIREAMFTFEDLGRLDNRALQSLLREISSDDLAVALRSASEDLAETFYAAMSQRAAATLREDLEIMPPKRLSEVETAQRNVVEAAMNMAAEGRLQLPGNSDEELV